MEKKILKKAIFSVSNKYLINQIKNSPHLLPVGSIHLYQMNLKEEFSFLVENKFRLIKVLPNSMDFSPEDKYCHINNNNDKPLHYKKWLTKYLQTQNFILLTWAQKERT